MRIVLNLNNYFHDHRSLARLFVNEDITTIGDLEEKVKKIFHIDGFHFVSQNHYLPTSEDVRMLSQDEVIWAVPNPSSQHRTEPCNSRNENNEDSEEEMTSKIRKNSLEKKVKKKKHREKIAQPNFDDEEMETEEIPVEENVVHEEMSVKKKKHKRETVEILVEEKTVNEEMSVKKKKQKRESAKMSVEEFEPKGYFQATGTLLPERRRVTLPTGTEDYLKKKKINIVKIERINPKLGTVEGKEETELVNNEKEETKLLNYEEEESKSISKQEEETSLAKNKEKTTEQSKEEICKFSLLDFIKSRTKQEENLQIFNNSTKTEANSSQINNNVQSSEKSFSSNTTMILKNNETVEEIVNKDWSSDSETNESISSFFSKKSISGMGHILSHLKSSENDIQSSSSEKKKRKRTRKRKKTNVETIFNSSLELTPTVNSVFFNGKPKIHVKFEDNDTSVKSEELTEENNKETSVITINDTIEDFDFNPELMLNEENLKKQPLMCSILPKINDIVAFKILRISEDCTPTLSTYIAAKILDFNQKSQDVECKILYGADQCVRPVSKFDLEERDEEEEIPDFKTFSWKELFMPRLLFP